MKYIVLILVVATGVGSSVHLVAPVEQVRAAAAAVVAEMGLTPESTGPVLVTRLVETEPSVLAQFVAEDPVPGEPGWDIARLQVVVRLSPAAGGTDIAVEARIERFGTPARIMLIPPAWTPARSNGRLEAKVVSAVTRRLDGRPGSLPRLSVGAAGPAPAEATDDPPFIPNVKASRDTGTGNQNETTIALLGPSVFGGWNDNRTGVYHVGFNCSHDTGLTWNATDTLMDYDGYAEDGDPVLASDDSGTVYYLWLSFNRSPQVGDLVLAKSQDSGRTWGPTQVVTPGTPNTLDDKPWMTIDGNNVFVTWYEFGGSNGLRFVRSTDRGATWGTPVTVGSGGNGSFPLRGQDSVVLVGWGMQNIQLNKSTDMGRTWRGQRQIVTCPWSPRSTPYRLNNIPSFAANRDRSVLYACFADSRNRSGQVDVFVSRSTNQGDSWSAPVKVNDTGSGDTTLQFYPWLALDPYDRLHVSWYDTRSGGNNIARYHAYSTDEGRTWSQNRRVSDTVALASTFIGDYSATAADAHRVYSLWSDTRNGPSDPDAYFTQGPLPATGPDAGVAAILAPGASVDSGTAVTPRARVRNYGSQPELVPVWFRISRQDSVVYEDSVSVAVGAGDTAQAVFGSWIALAVDSFAAVAFTTLSGDSQPGNDTARSSFQVVPLQAASEPGMGPSVLVLERVGPSPATGAVNVTYSLPAAGPVSVVLLDAAGRAVATPVAGRQQSGRHQLRLDTRRLAAGVYWLRLSAGGRVLSARVLVAR